MRPTDLVLESHQASPRKINSRHDDEMVLNRFGHNRLPQFIHHQDEVKKGGPSVRSRRQLVHQACRPLIRELQQELP